MSASRFYLALFLLVLSWHLGLSMELPLIAWIGTGFTLIAALKIVEVEHPTYGLIFVLFATGALTGNQVLADWALEESWPQENGFGAGVMISLLCYVIWVFAADKGQPAVNAVNRSSQTILVWGLLTLLLLETSDALIISSADLGLTAEDAGQIGEQLHFPLPALAGLLLAALSLLSSPGGQHVTRRMALMLPVLIALPLMFNALERAQGPMVAALGSMMPRGGDYTPTGYSPYQTLRASVFLRPSTEPVMRIQTDALPSRYLAGNRLVNLNNDLVWLPSVRALRSYDIFDAELLEGEQWRYQLDSHHFSAGNSLRSTMTIFNLANDDYLFTTPNTTHVAGRFSAISRNAADVLTPNYDRGADARWVLESGPAVAPDSENAETLLLPDFWDAQLQEHSEALAGVTRQETADNIVEYFLARDYTLQTSFDPAQPFHDFFLNDKAAYCFWFASATTLALRANGIPSRLVGGYLIHEQLSEDLWLVRERDAHSWVEWQDEDGYWHTIDPTPASITAFFGGYRSSSLSQWYHRLAGQWEILIDRVLQNQLAASAITWGGLAILVFLFAREYRRIRNRQESIGDLGLRFQKLWQRFLRITQLPDQQSWTSANYAANLPQSWPEEYRGTVREFLADYSRQRFGSGGSAGLEELEAMLQRIQRDSRTLSTLSTHSTNNT